MGLAFLWIFLRPIHQLTIPSKDTKAKVTDKRIQDRSIFSSIRPKFDDQFFVDLRALYKLQT